MPAIIGPFRINSISGGVVNMGDSFYISPRSTSESVSGSGSNNTGDFICTNSGFSKTKPIEPAVSEGNIVSGT
ncbi:spore germination protein [Halobacillus sp. Marseille-Q1614]|uniref:spore germination protein n=1 Tax=Halobacillus sp. Marseille-Q1614 TaxID=2709134 RepID=UPI00156EF577|nr:spore germination protein [Halobacillus sp. Marseille-Q1614]